MNENDILSKLVVYGINYTETMERFMNDKELYVHCIGMFRTDENFEKLETAIASHNYEDAFMCAHTLKGVVGNLGLIPLYKVIFDLVEALRSQDYSDTAKLDQLYARVAEEKSAFDALLD